MLIPSYIYASYLHEKGQVPVSFDLVLDILVATPAPYPWHQLLFSRPTFSPSPASSTSGKLLLLPLVADTQFSPTVTE